MTASWDSIQPRSLPDGCVPVFHSPTRDLRQGRTGGGTLPPRRTASRHNGWNWTTRARFLGGFLAGIAFCGLVILIVFCCIWGHENIQATGRACQAGTRTDVNCVVGR